MEKKNENNVVNEASLRTENEMPPSLKAASKRMPFSARKGASRVLRIFNLCLAAVLFTASLSYAIFRFCTQDAGIMDIRGLTALASAFLAVVPFLAERIFKCSLPDFLLILFFVFVLFAAFIGSSLGMYGRWSNIAYDKIVHGIFGYLGAVGGLFIVCRLGNYGSARPVFVAIVCFAVSLCCGALWEIWEFGCDRLLNASAQGSKVYEGYAIVKDTMGDIIANFIGAVVFLVHFVLHRATKKNLLMGSMLQDFLADPYTAK